MPNFIARRARARLLLTASLFCGLAPSAFAGDLTGRIADASGVRALTGAKVQVLETGATATAGRGGEYRFADLPAGEYTVRAEYEGAVPAEGRISVGAEGAFRLDLTLSAAAGPDDILVVGQRATQASSLTRQRNADTVKSVLTRDAIGQFPDQNVTEALRRLPGVNVLNDQGEGRFFVLRGLDPNLNSTSINGVRVPAPESDIRGVALDVVASELVESIEVQKSLTPDMDADALGGSVEINTTSAFDRKGSFFAVVSEGQYNDLQDTLSPRVAVDASTVIANRLGVSAGFSWLNRKFGSENAEAGDFGVLDDGTFAPEEIEFRDYEIRRNRLGATLNLDYKLSPDTTLFARGLYSRFLDDEFRSALNISFDEGPAEGGGRAPVYSSEDGEITIERQVRDRLETQEILSLTAGGETFKGAWTLNYQMGYSVSSENEPGTILPVFEQGYEPGDGVTVATDFSSIVPAFAVTGTDAFTDPAEFELDAVEFTSGFTEDTEWSGKVDVGRSFALAGGQGAVQIGGKVRLRDKFYDVSEQEFGFEGDEDLTLEPFAGEVDYGLGAINPLPSGAAFSRFFRANPDQFEADEAVGAFNSAVQSYAAEENIFAGYALGRFERGPWRSIFGVRVEHTTNELEGNIVELVEEGGVVDGVTLDEDTVFVTPTRFDRDYTIVLPSANFRIEAIEDVVFRLAGYRSLGRPNFEQFAPRFGIEENDEGEREGEFGNPALEPFRAWNADVSAEWYFAENAVLSLGGFYKRIDDFIFTTVFDADEGPFNGVFNGVAFTEAAIPQNGERARVLGLEFNYQQALTFLPGLLDGLLVGVNYTLSDTEANTGERIITLPTNSRHVLSTSIGYEKGPLSLRAGGVYRSSYLDELGGDPEEDRFVTEHFQIDLTAKYRINKCVQVYAEAVNANNRPFVAVFGGADTGRLSQFEEYGWTAKWGARLTY